MSFSVPCGDLAGNPCGDIFFTSLLETNLQPKKNILAESLAEPLRDALRTLRGRQNRVRAHLGTHSDTTAVPVLDALRGASGRT